MKHLVTFVTGEHEDRKVFNVVVVKERDEALRMCTKHNHALISLSMHMDQEDDDGFAFRQSREVQDMAQRGFSLHMGKVNLFVEDNGGNFAVSPVPEMGDL